MTNSERIKKIPQSFFPVTYVSTENKRIVVTNEAGVQSLIVKGEKKSTHHFSTDEQLYYFDISTRNIEIDFANMLLSKDGIKIGAILNVAISILDNEEKILRIFENENKEIELFKQSVAHYFQKIINDIDTDNIKSNIKLISDSLIELNSSITELNDCCYISKSFTLKNLEILDKELADLQSKATKDKQREIYAKNINSIKIESIDTEQILKRKETINQNEIEKLIVTNRLDTLKNTAASTLTIDRNRFQFDNTKRVIDRLNKMKEISLLKSQEGQMIYFPNEIFNLLLKEKELERLRENEKIKIIQTTFNQMVNSSDSYNAGFNKGYVSPIKKILENYFSIQLNDTEPPSIPPEDSPDGTRQ